jgi:peptidoglycan hydrolase CwlO-like protein
MQIIYIVLIYIIMSITLPPEIWSVIIKNIDLSGREDLLDIEEKRLKEKEYCLNELNVNIERQLDTIGDIMDTLNSVNSSQTKMTNYIETKYNEIHEYYNSIKELNDLIDKECYIAQDD